MLLRRISTTAAIPSLAAVGHGRDVRTLVQWLLELADLTDYLVVARNGEGNDGL